jgi:fibro-slime domain-containing protein
VLAGKAGAPEYLVTMPKAPPLKILVLAVCSVVGSGCAKVSQPPGVGGGPTTNDSGLPNFGDALRAQVDGISISDSIRLTCGNGHLDLGEGCDDGNTMNGDGCTQLCQVESDWSCPTPGQPCMNLAKCGDGKLSSSEGCDDGNTTSGDGCSATCMVETGYQCRVPGRSCIPLCGDGMKIGDETCDDGNTVSGDGCSSTCQIEPGATCPTPGQKCMTAVCGNGVVETGESCDAGPNNGLFLGDGSGCSKTCTKEPKCRDGATTRACDVSCGNGNKEAGEQCDDGNQANGDGCSSTCQVEGGFMCPDMVRPDSEACVGNADPTAQCLHLPVIVRDFKSEHETGGHPDFLYYGATVSPPITVAGVVLNQPAPFSFNKRYCVPNSSGPARKNDSTARCWDLAQPTLDADGKPVFNAARPGGNLCDCQFTDYSHDTNGGNVPGYTQLANGPTQGLVYTAGAVGHPMYKGPAPIIKDATSFSQWWRDNTFDNMTHAVVTIQLAPFGTGQFRFSSDPNSITGGFFPADPPGAGMFPPGPIRTVPGTGEPLLCNLWPYWYSSPAFGAGNNCVANQYLFPPSIPATAMCPMPGAGQSQVPCAGGIWAPMTQGTFHNSWYTTEARYLFNFNGAFSLQFYGDDDLFIYVNGQLVIDLGGVHQRLPGQVQVDATGLANITEGGEIDPMMGTIIPCTATSMNPYTLGVNNATCPGGTCDCRTRMLDLGLKTGNTYEIAVFHADQHPTESNYQLTLSGFSTTRSACEPKCGDGVKSGGEECDDGAMNSDTAYGGCTTMCKFGPFCGDGTTNGPEECDLGRMNGTPYGDPNGCTTACKHPHYCGDGNVDSSAGEKCDLGPNNGVSGQPCDSKCQLVLG